MSGALSGRAVLVTRPAGVSMELVALLRAEGGEAVVLPAIDGRILKIRKASTPDDVHREIYRVLQVPPEVMKPVKTWTTSR